MSAVSRQNLAMIVQTRLFKQISNLVLDNCALTMCSSCACFGLKIEKWKQFHNMWKLTFIFNNQKCSAHIPVWSRYNLSMTVDFWTNEHSDYCSWAMCNKVLDDPNYAVVPRALGWKQFHNMRSKYFVFHFRVSSVSHFSLVSGFLIWLYGITCDEIAFF